MFHIVHQSAFYLHILVGSVALIIFWLPFLTKKGGIDHRRYGQIFTKMMYIVAFSGIVMSSLVLVDPIAVRFPDGDFDVNKMADILFWNRVETSFLFMLSILVIVFLRQSMLVLKAKHQRELLRTPIHLGTIGFLGVCSIFVGLVSIKFGIILLGVFAILGIVTVLKSFHYIYKPAIKDREWIIVHLDNVCSAGISTYTAFFAFGGRRLLEDFLPGNLQMIPWILPGIVGGIAISLMIKKFGKKFNVVESTIS